MIECSTGARTETRCCDDKLSELMVGARLLQSGVILDVLRHRGFRNDGVEHFEGYCDSTVCRS
jgi:hypothetical protein